MPVHAEQSVRDVIVDMLETDETLDAAAQEAVLQALTAVGDDANQESGDQHSTFLTEISVAGFRGIGRQARLTLEPTPGLTVVSGRNGSGKSSFAEALELALTGTSYRWHEKKEVMWTETWQNLHHHDPCAIRAGFTAEGTGPFTVGVDWAPGAALSDRTTWTQVGAGKHQDGTDLLGWSRALELWRPVLSYEELGRLFDGGPSVLYDALDTLLGLEALSDAEKWLAAELKSNKEPRTRADQLRKEVVATLGAIDDERAVKATQLLKKRPVPLDQVRDLATGAGGEQLATVPALKALAELDVASLDEIRSTAEALRAATQKATTTATEVADAASQRSELLQAALRWHDHAGDGECPVCGQGRLDADWAAQARNYVTESASALAEYNSAATELKHVRSAAAALLTRVALVEEPSGVALASLEAYNNAASTARQVPDGDGALADHVEVSLVAVADAAEALRNEAGHLLAAREDAWSPVAAELGGWVTAEEEARQLDNTVAAMTAAKKWMTEHGTKFRNLRLEPVAAQARQIWAQLRQESNVDLGEITLQGTATKRRAVLGGSVDGQPTKALSVMSQGELHALALALFLPRATTAKSPFRFVLLDDPIQAMDPAKIDGFVHVLSEVAKTHQVIVFSHDDRLASVIRETGTDATLVEVVRESESRVTPRANESPALLQALDVLALLKDDNLPDEIKVKVVPGLFRIALESAARQAYFTKQSLAGQPREEFEKAWNAAKRTRARLALAVLDDATADVTHWIEAKPARRTTMRLCNAVHQGAVVTEDDARALRSTVKEVLALR